MLEYKDRLALPHADGARKQTKYGYTKYWSPASKFDLMNRLGEYEDTGLTPEEIAGLCAKYKTRIGDRITYMGTTYEVMEFTHDFAHNLVCLQSVNDDRHHEVDFPVFLFSPDYQMR